MSHTTVISPRTAGNPTPSSKMSPLEVISRNDMFFWDFFLPENNSLILYLAPLSLKRASFSPAFPMKCTLALSLCAVAFADIPVPNNNWCGDVVETITTDGSAPVVGRQYRLCVDNKNLRWNQMAADNSSLNLFNGTDMFKFTASASAPGGWTCTTKTTGPEQPSFMPYRMTTMDPGTTLNQTKSLDGFDNVEDYWHFRQGSPPKIPNENMHWDIAPAVKGQPARAMLKSECIQRSGTDRKGPLQDGARDFSKNYAYSFSQPEIPAGVVCKPMAADYKAAEFFGPASVFGV
jgi:hypothetical protein